MMRILITLLALSFAASSANAWEKQDPVYLEGLPFADLWYVRAQVDDNTNTVNSAKKRDFAAEDKAQSEAYQRRRQNPFFGGGEYLGSSFGRTIIMTTHAGGCAARSNGSLSDAVPLSLAKLDNGHKVVMAGCGYVANSDPQHIKVKWVDAQDFETLDSDDFSKVDLKKLENSGDIPLQSSFQFIQ